MFAYSCKQANDGDLGQEKPTPTPSNEVTITVQGDDGVIVKTPNTIKFRKNSIWKDIKQKAIEKITTKENKEIKEWRIKDSKGAVLKDADTFEKDTIIFAVSKDKEKPIPPTNLITITIEADEGYTFNEAKTPCAVEEQKGSLWSNIKVKAEAKIELKDGYEKTGWKLGGKNGGYLEDNFSFNESVTIFVTSKKKGEPEKPRITITVKGDEGVEVSSHGNFTVDSGAKWESIKAQAVAIASVKECFEITTWHLNNADGVLINDETEFKANTIVFAVSKRKVVQYKVVHAQENIENDEYTAKETEEKEGEAGKNTLAEAKQYEGFGCQGLAQEAIKADGSTVVQIKYKRNRVSLILDLQGGKTTTALENGEENKKLLNGKFGARVDVQTPTKANVNFECWEPSLPQIFPATNSTVIHVAKYMVATQNIRVTITGDERIEVAEPKYIEISEGKTFVDIKAKILEKISLKSEWSNEYYEFYDWRVNGEDGNEILDTTQITENMVIYARTNYKKFKTSKMPDGRIKLEGYDVEKPRGRIFLPKEINMVDTSAFENCVDLTAVDFSPCKNIIEARYKVFKGCKNLKKVNLTGCSKFKSIGFGSFHNCENLESIDLSSCPEFNYFGNSAFENCCKLKTVNLTGCIKISTIGNYAFEGCKILEGIDLSLCTEFKEIRSGVFRSCIEAEIKLPKSIEKIGSEAFGGKEANWCKKVLMPSINKAIKELVKNSKYPEERIVEY